MGSSLSKIYDDYEVYEKLCEEVGEEPHSMQNFYKHEKLIMDKYGWSRTYYGYKKED